MWRTGIEALADGRWLTRARVLGYAAIALGVSVVVAVGWIASSSGGIDPSGRPIGTDFINVYAAGRMVLAGDPAGPYDWPALYAAQQAVIPSGDFYSWHYPPVFLPPAAALALLPHPVALAVYLGLTFAAFLAVVLAIVHRFPGALVLLTESSGRQEIAPDSKTRSILSSTKRFRLVGECSSAAGRGEVLLLAAGFPAVFVNAGHGQNGFLTAALLGGALLSLPRRPILAGILFGLMAYKPQLGLLVPLALAAGGHWRTFCAAAGTVIATHIAVFAAYGPAPFAAFLAGLGPTRDLILIAGEPGLEKMQSVFSAVRLLGGAPAFALSVQGLATVLCGAAMVWIWRRTEDPASRAAALAFALPLSTPYVVDYDLTLIGIGIAFLAARGRVHGFPRYQASLLAALWALPILARPAAGLLALPLTPPLLIAALGLLVTSVRQSGETRARAPMS